MTDILKNTVSEDEKYMLMRLSGLAEKNDAIKVGFFLTPREVMLAQNYASSEGFRDRMCLYGGFADAERRCALFLPEWMEAYRAEGSDDRRRGAYDKKADDSYVALLLNSGIISEDDIGISYISLTGSGYVRLSHSDWLGALMSLGLKRECIGDIIISSEHTAVCAVLSKNAAYVTAELKRAARDSVRAQICSRPENTASPLTETYSGSVKSPRADGVVRELCHISREAALSLIISGDVSVNYTQISCPDGKIEAGDIISVKGRGKFKISSVGDKTKSGRLRLIYEKYKG